MSCDFNLWRSGMFTQVPGVSESGDPAPWPCQGISSSSRHSQGTPHTLHPQQKARVWLCMKQKESLLNNYEEEFLNTCAMCLGFQRTPNKSLQRRDYGQLCQEKESTAKGGHENIKLQRWLTMLIVLKETRTDRVVTCSRINCLCKIAQRTLHLHFLHLIF